MGDLALGTDGDLLFEGGDLVINEGIDAVSQFVSQRLKMVAGEWFLDTSAGVPYFDGVLDKNPSPQFLDSVFKKAILDTPGIDELMEFSLTLDTVTRSMVMAFKARCKDGEIDFRETIGV